MPRDIHRARILRATGRNSFGIIFDSSPAICEVHCCTIVADDIRAFNSRIRSLPPLASVEHAQDFSIPVSIELGRYCLYSKAFVECTLLPDS